MIGRVWRWLVDAHQHEWETIEKRELYSRVNDDHVGVRYVLRCKTCGDIRSRDV